MILYKCTQLWHNKKKKSWFKVENILKSDLSSNQLLVRSQFSLISAGTEQMILADPPTGKTAEKMQVPYMLGSFDADFTYGYSIVGEVVEGPSDWIGRLVHVMHPHQDLILVSHEDVFPIPEFIRPETATLASNLETIINAVWDSGVTVGDKVLIIGLGIIGALLARVISHIPGTEVFIYEKDPYREKICSAINLHCVSDESNLTADYTIAFNTSCSGSGLQMAIDQVTHEGSVVELSWFGPKTVTLNLGGDFHYGRKKIISSQVSHIPVIKRGHFDNRSRKQIVFDLLKEINFDSLISRRIPFEEAPEFYTQLKERNIRDIGVLFYYK